MISRNQHKVLLITILIALFMSQSCAGIASPAPALMTATVTETITPTATIAPQPTSTQAPLDIVEPIVTSPRLRFDSWSPDSQWIAYWSAEGEDLPAHLAFINVQSHEVCQHDTVLAQDIWSGYVSWRGNDDVIAVLDLSGSALRGMPCEQFLSTAPVTISNTEASTSSDGRYLAETTISGWEEQLIHNVSTITEISTKQTIVTIQWDGSPHIGAESGWLNNELFLVGLDVNRGPLYTSVPDGRVGNVVSDLLGLDIQDVGYVSHVGRHTNAAKNEYHLLLTTYNEPPGSPLLLYHSELGLVEELPFYQSRIVNGSNFSPDGKWLFLSYPSSKESDEIEDFWIRAVGPPESPAVKLAEGIGFAGFSQEAKKMAFVRSYVYILNFPSGEVLSQWRVRGYDIDRVWWSPDGNYLVMQGFGSTSPSETLFVIEP